MNNTVTETTGQRLNRIATLMGKVLTEECGAPMRVLLAPGCAHDFVVVATDAGALDSAVAFLSSGGAFQVLSVEHDPFKGDPNFAGEPAEHWAFVKDVRASAK